MNKLDGFIISKDYDSGMSSLQIAEKYNVTKEAILYHLRKNNTVMRKIQPIENKEEIVSLYMSGKSTIEIGEMYNTSHTRIIKILKSLGVKRRTKVEALEKYCRKNECVVCGKIFRPREYFGNTAGLNRKTCSSDCLSKLLSKNNSGENSNNWKGGYSQAHYQRIRRSLKPDICEICGTTEHIETHHVDRNKSNNSPENLRVLCTSDHALIHYIEDTRGLNGELLGDGKYNLLKNKVLSEG